VPVDRRVAVVAQRTAPMGRPAGRRTPPPRLTRVPTCSASSALSPLPAASMIIIHLLSQPRGADQAAYAHSVKAPAPSLSVGGGLGCQGVWSRRPAYPTTQADAGRRQA
jgi:hypothetical protein